MEGGMCWMEWERSQNSLTQLLNDSGEAKYQPKMKYTIPGPMTLVDVLFDDFYGETNQREMIEDLISCINRVNNNYHYFLL